MRVLAVVSALALGTLTAAACDDGAGGGGGEGGAAASGLATADGAITALATNGTDLVFLDWSSGVSKDTLLVRKVPVTGGAVTTLATASPFHTGSIASGMVLDGARVVFTVATASDDFELHAVPLAGGATSVVLGGLSWRPGDVVADAAGLVWMDDSGAVSALPNGATERVALGGSGCRGGIALDATSAYCFTTNGEFMRIPRDGSGAVSLYTAGLSSGFKVSPLISRTVLVGDTIVAGVWSSMDGCHVFESTLAGAGKERSKDCVLQMTADPKSSFGARDMNLLSKSSIELIRYAPGAAGPVVVGSSPVEVRAMAIDGARLYYADDTSKGASIHAVPRGD